MWTQIEQAFSPWACRMLLTGGSLYTIGLIPWLMKPVEFHISVWHAFVIVAGEYPRPPLFRARGACFCTRSLTPRSSPPPSLPLRCRRGLTLTTNPNLTLRCRRVLLQHRVRRDRDVAAGAMLLPSRGGRALTRVRRRHGRVAARRSRYHLVDPDMMISTSQEWILTPRCWCVFYLRGR